MDTLYINESDDRAVATCWCGTTQCGIVVFDINDGVKGQDVNPDIEWWVRWSCFMAFHLSPSSQTFFGRLRNAWNVLCGRTVEASFELDAARTRRFGEWLVKKASTIEDQKPTEDQ